MPDLNKEQTTIGLKLTDSDKKAIYRSTFQGVIANVTYWTGRDRAHGLNEDHLIEYAIQLSDKLIDRLES